MGWGGGGLKSNCVIRDGGLEIFFGKFYYMYGDLLSLNFLGELGFRFVYDWLILYYWYIDLFFVDWKLNFMLMYISILLL